MEISREQISREQRNRNKETETKKKAAAQLQNPSRPCYNVRKPQRKSSPVTTADKSLDS